MWSVNMAYYMVQNAYISSTNCLEILALESNVLQYIS